MKTNCSVTVVYEDEARRAEATALCDQLVGRLWADGELDLNWWSFEQLQADECTEEALTKATQADVIIFATYAKRELPVEFSHWIEQWLSRRGAHEGTVVGLLGPDAGPDAAQRHLHLRKIAHRGGMDYLTGLPEYVAHHISDSRESCHERAHRMTSVMDEILHHAPPPPHILS